MKDLSEGAVYAFRIAAYEAGQLNAEEIEPEHLFIGCLSLEKILERRDETIPEKSLAIIRAEWEAMSTLMEICSHNPVVLRRLMRLELRKRSLPGTSHPRHRSPAGRECFSRAQNHAGNPRVTSNDLFSAVLDCPGVTITSVLTEAHQCVAAVRDSDIILPPGKFTAGTMQGAPGEGEDKNALSQDINRYSGSLDQWPESGWPHSMTQSAIRKKRLDLCWLHLHRGELTNLLSALQDLRPSLDDEREYEVIIRDLDAESKAGKPLSDPLRKRIENLLQKSEKDGCGAPAGGW